MTIYHNVYTKCDPHMTFPEILFLHEMVKGLPEDARILEVGAWKGGSTVNIGTACLGTKRKITVVDIWDYPNEGLYKTWLENVTMAGVLPLLEIRRGDSLDVMRELAKEKPFEYDLCLLDTDHEYVRTDGELTYALDLVKPGGWILMHDIGDVIPYLYPGCTMVWYERAQTILKNIKKADALYGGQKF